MLTCCFHLLLPSSLVFGYLLPHSLLLNANTLFPLSGVCCCSCARRLEERRAVSLCDRRHGGTLLSASAKNGGKSVNETREEIRRAALWKCVQFPPVRLSWSALCSFREGKSWLLQLWPPFQQLNKEKRIFFKASFKKINPPSLGSDWLIWAEMCHASINTALTWRSCQSPAGQEALKSICFCSKKEAQSESETRPAPALLSD